MHKSSKRMLWIRYSDLGHRLDSRGGWFSLDLSAFLLSRNGAVDSCQPGGESQEVCGRKAFSSATIYATSQAGRPFLRTRKSTPGWPKISSRISPISFHRKFTNRACSLNSTESHLPSSLKQGGVQSVITVVARPRDPAATQSNSLSKRFAPESCRSRPIMYWTESSSMHATMELTSNGREETVTLSF